MNKEIDIDYKITVNINKLINIKKTIEEELNKLIKKNYIEEYGYLKKIIKINKYEAKDIYNNDFKSNIFININFRGEFINPVIDSIIDCIVILDNSNISIGISNDIIKVAIINSDNKIKKGDKVKIKVLDKQVRLNDNVINIVGSIIK